MEASKAKPKKKIRWIPPHCSRCGKFFRSPEDGRWHDCTIKKHKK